ncbi:MAG TPA: hypothetical protein DEQ02_05095 [Ruminococcaceae bacterium]|nr:hypothetical protein [Oscillospiraceae bacterium]
MKKLAVVILLLFLFCVVTGCSDASDSPSAGAGAPGGESEVIDLTEMSSTVVYTEVYNMVTTPDDYVGKTIKVDGLYTPSFFDTTGDYYHYILVEDATACCQQGLEFVWEGDHAYPGDYPAEGEEILIEGVFTSYMELGEKYYYILTEDISA